MAGTGAIQRCRRALLLAAFVMPTVSGPAQAGDWLTTATLSQTTTYDNNPELGQNGRQSNTLKEITPSLSSAYESETYGLDVNASGTLIRSRNTAVTGDTTRIDLNAANNLDFDRFRLFADTVFSSRAVENSEFNDNELAADASTASVSNDESVEDLTVSSRGEWDMSDLVTLFATYSFRQVEFDGGTGDSFVDNDIGVGATWELSDRLEIGPSLNFSRLEPDDDTEDDTTVLRADVNANYLYSDDLVATLSVGILDIDNRQDISLDAQLQRSFEKATLSFGVSRDARAGDESQIEINDSAQIDLTYDISDLTTANVGLSFRENEDTESQQAGLSLLHSFSDKIAVGVEFDWIETTDTSVVDETETNQFRADPFIAWTLNEDVNARLSYRELQERESDRETVRSRRVTFTISYSKQYD